MFEINYKINIDNFIIISNIFIINFCEKLFSKIFYKKYWPYNNAKKPH